MARSVRMVIGGLIAFVCCVQWFQLYPYLHTGISHELITSPSLTSTGTTTTSTSTSASIDCSSSSVGADPDPVVPFRSHVLSVLGSLSGSGSGSGSGSTSPSRSACHIRHVIIYNQAFRMFDIAQQHKPGE